MPVGQACLPHFEFIRLMGTASIVVKNLNDSSHIHYTSLGFTRRVAAIFNNCIHVHLYKYTTDQLLQRI